MPYCRLSVSYPNKQFKSKDDFVLSNWWLDRTGLSGQVGVYNLTTAVGDDLNIESREGYQFIAIWRKTWTCSSPIHQCRRNLQEKPQTSPSLQPDCQVDKCLLPSSDSVPSTALRDSSSDSGTAVPVPDDVALENNLKVAAGLTQMEASSYSHGKLCYSSLNLKNCLLGVRASARYNQSLISREFVKMCPFVDVGIS